MHAEGHSAGFYDPNIPTMAPNAEKNSFGPVVYGTTSAQYAQGKLLYLCCMLCRGAMLYGDKITSFWEALIYLLDLDTAGRGVALGRDLVT